MNSLTIFTWRMLILLATLMSGSLMAQEMIKSTRIKVATFNVSMEALNYIPFVKGKNPKVTGNELAQALANNHQQIKNIAEIIQRTNPDIILLNEFDRDNEHHQSLKTFLNDYLSIGQNGQQGINFPYFYQGPVNTGVNTPFDLNNDGISASSPADSYGFGYFPGHFAMALLSKYPIDEAKIRTFQLFKWKDMPNALKPINPLTNTPWYTPQAWDEMRLSSKSHWDIPVNVNGQNIHLLASHPTPPVFDGPEDRNGKRNHDEIRFWHDYITHGQSSYIYDDKGNKGGLAEQEPFIILGDQNASNVDGDAIYAGISMLLAHPNIQDPKPQSLGAQAHAPDNINSLNHTAHWGMRADYVLPSKLLFKLIDSGVFWPLGSDDSFRLIKDRAASSDHRLVWVELSF